jgi:squalene-hopene/tetraprenyl-beta-curcumene cyclase
MYPVQVRTILRIAVLFLLAEVSAFCWDWNPKLAAEYLDSREKAWFVWKPAIASGTPCVSCHTSVPYLIARPALRRALGESGRTEYETGLVDGVRARVTKTDANDLFAGISKNKLLSQQVLGAETVLAALVLVLDDAGRGDALSPETEKALKRMWLLQIRTGNAKGAWLWSDFDLDPWETPDAAFFGAALGALATGATPAEYQARPEIQANVAELKDYLRSTQKRQPLHNRLILLWAASRLHDLLPEADRKAIFEEVWRKQEADGGWTLPSLGAWKKRADAPPAEGSNGYATGLVAFTLEQAGIRGSDARLARSLAWLKSHQNPESGYWVAESMNHRHENGSMPALFMRDAATGYATLALLGSSR